MKHEELTLRTSGQKHLVKRLHNVKGQIDGIERMISSGRSAEEIYNQLKAAERALHQTIYGVLDELLKKQFAEKLAQRLTLCPGNCSDAGRLQFLKREFSKLDIQQLIDELGWLNRSFISQERFTRTSRRR